MTLAELAKAAKVKEVSIPSVLKDFEIENPDKFCRYAVAKYLKSIDFKDDVIEILDLLVKTTVPLEEFSLIFVTHHSGRLQLKTYGGTIEESL